MTKYGHFSQDGFEYIVTRPDAPRPWMNYIWNGEYMGLMSQVGTGRAMVEVDKRRTKHLSGRMVYLIDAETGRHWTANALPACAARESYRCAHGWNYTTIDVRNEGVESSWRVMAPRQGPCEIWTLRLRNATRRPRRLKVMLACDTPIGGWYKGAVNGWFDEKLSALLVSNVVRFGGNYEHRTTGRREQAFLTLDARPSGFDGLRSAFVGYYNDVQTPQAVRQGGCSNSLAEFDQPILVLEATVRLAPGAETTLNAIAGVWGEEADVAGLRRRYFAPGAIEAELAAVKKDARQAVDSVYVRTPDAELTTFYNGWLKHQLRLNVTWARGYYNGYRDLCQDVTNYAAVEFPRAWEKLREVLSYQYVSGFAPRGWIESEIIDQEYADSPVWIVPAVYAMLMEKGDRTLLEESVPFRDGPAGSVYQHAKRSVDHLWGDRGRHGLSKVHRGDWNDMLNMMGAEGRGESVWLSLALHRSLKQLEQMAALCGRKRDAATAAARAAKLAEALDKHAWDAKGGFYHRGYTDAGTKVGTAASGEGMFLNPQSWAVVSGAARGKRAAAAMKKVDELLETELGCSTIQRAFTGGFRPDIGFLSVIRPGENVNGGIYNHANMFKVAADCVLKRNAAAWRTLSAALPFRKLPGRNCEPFVMPNGYVGPLAKARYGEAPFGWVTGSCGWLATVVIEYVLGLKPTWEGLRIDPCLPPHWKTCSAVRPFRGALYRVQFEQAGRGKACNRIAEIRVDGEPIRGDVLPHEKGKHYRVKVRMEA
jgi:cellobiose phosphorylase